MGATTTRKRRRRQPQRLGPHHAGSERAIELVRGYIRQQQRIRDRGDAWAVELLRKQRRDRKRFV